MSTGMEIRERKSVSVRLVGRYLNIYISVRLQTLLQRMLIRVKGDTYKSVCYK